jgi:DNA-binding response OmpR family regulator
MLPLVLHVEDDALVREYLTVLLCAEGYRIVSAASGDEMLEQVRGQSLQPDILIVDYNLGADMSGTDVAESLGSIVGYVPPIIMLTADPINAEVPWIPSAPLWLVRKPCDPNVLLAGLSALVQFQRLTMAARGRGDGASISQLGDGGPIAQVG